MLDFPPASNAADWVVDVIATDENSGDAFPLSGYLIEIELRSPSGPKALIASTANGLVTMTPTGFNINVPASQMGVLPAATYALKGRITAPTGEIVQIFNAPFGVYDGGFN